MTILKWAAGLVTAAMCLMNAGVVPDSSVGSAVRILGAILALLALVALVGFLTLRPWGRLAVIGIGALNAGTAIVVAFAGVDGWPVGLVLGALGALLAAFFTPQLDRERSAA